MTSLQIEMIIAAIILFILITIFLKKTHVMTSSQLLITLGLNHHESYRPFIPFFFIIMSLIARNPILQS